MERWILC